ncbi:hypothetical protein AB0N38_10595 [Micromonospora aurantiaca]|uniref:hypothetical protein n=1 Tax=Micromonospora aurantiaca (nom. illeg.) TaxID=47850 RepID=UPI00342FBAE0
MTGEDDDRPRCTLPPDGRPGTVACYCTGRPGCQMQRDEDEEHERDWPDEDIEEWVAVHCEGLLTAWQRRLLCLLTAARDVRFSL